MWKPKRTSPITFQFILTIIVVLIFRAPSVNAQSPNDLLKLSPPQLLGDGWETGNLKDGGIAVDPIRKLLHAIRADTFPDVHSVLIAHHGRLVMEAYFPGYAWDYQEENFRGPLTEFGSNTLDNMASVTKSVTGLLVGIAMDRAFIPGSDAGIFSFFPEYSSLSNDRKSGITIGHLMTMTSGLRWNEQDVFYSEEENDIIQLFLVPNPVEFILAKDLDHMPGSQWYYNGGGTNLLGEIIRRSSGLRLDQFAEEYLFAPLQITGVEWAFIRPDFVYASGDLKMRPRDLAKIGQLLLNGGTWQGTRIVSESWVKEMTRTHVPLGPGQGYGLFWWTRVYEQGSDPVNAFMADGWGGQRVIVFPDLDLVVVFTGGNYTRQHRLDEIITTYILPAVCMYQRN